MPLVYNCIVYRIVCAYVDTDTKAKASADPWVRLLSGREIFNTSADARTASHNENARANAFIIVLFAGALFVTRFIRAYCMWWCYIEVAFSSCYSLIHSSSHSS